MGSASINPIDSTVLPGVADVFVLSFPVVVGEEVLVIDGIYINMSWGFNGGLSEVRFVSFGVNGEGAEESL